MNKGSNGTGSASIVLIFAVLCMTIFALISLKTALADKVLVDEQELLTVRYYDADMRAEYTLAGILKEDELPREVSLIDNTDNTQHPDAKVVSFVCDVSDAKELYVEAAIYENSYDILKWQMRDRSSWIADDTLPVWTGKESF